jgi:hypothetical protein
MRDFRQGWCSNMKPKILKNRYEESSFSYLKNEGGFEKMHLARRN